MRRPALFALCLSLSLGAAQADRLELRDGATLEGTYVGGERGVVHFELSDGLVRAVAVTDIAALRFELPPEPTVRVPTETKLSLRLTQPIGHGRHAGSLFKGVLDAPLEIDGQVVAAAGTPALGRISSKSRASGAALRLTDLIIGGHRHPITVTPVPIEGTLDAQALIEFQLTSGFEVLESDLGR